MAPLNAGQEMRTVHYGQVKYEQSLLELEDNPSPPSTSKIPPKMTPYSVEWWTLWSDRLKFAAVGIGALVTVITVVGWYFTVKSGKLKDEASKRAKQESDAAIATAHAAAEEAKKGAAIANEGQAKANKAAEEAKRDAAVANEGQAKANKAAAEANERAAELELELEKLRQKVTWRSISTDDFTVIAQAFNHWKGKSIMIWAPMNDPEAIHLRHEISKIAEYAGVNVTGLALAQTMKVPIGIKIYIRYGILQFDKNLVQNVEIKDLISAMKRLDDFKPLLYKDDSDFRELFGGPGDGIDLVILVGQKSRGGTAVA